VRGMSSGCEEGGSVACTSSAPMSWLNTSRCIQASRGLLGSTGS
jgi:hypothetical protein